MEQLPQQKQFQKVMECWEKLLGVMAIKTQPLYIKQEILYVATSSATLSQELSFRVPQLLQKLNDVLPKPLDNIRFSAAQWHTYHFNKSGQTEKNNWLEHPSIISKSEKPTLLKSTHKNRSPQTTFENWAKAVKTRSEVLPICPQCHCPTPPGEIKRWSVCGICFAKHC
ncbi:MAG: DciA family protein [Trichodesmium sp. MAG_R04]|nr:DciA family protein [Trichodesmium sp. MAG_R04]